MDIMPGLWEPRLHNDTVLKKYPLLSEMQKGNAHRRKDLQIAVIQKQQR